MAELTRASKCAIVEQPTDAIVPPSGATDFLALQAGFSLEQNPDILENNELRNTIAPAEPFFGIERTTFSMDHYDKHSGVVATPPEHNLLYKSLLGSESIAATEYNTVAGSTVSVVNVDAGEGASFDMGEALLVKKSAGGVLYEIRNIHSIAADALTLSHNLNTAPGVGIDLGRAVLYKGTNANHPKLSVWNYIGEGGAIQAASKMQVTSGSVSITAGEFVNTSFEASGLEMYFDPITIGATSKYIDFTTTAGTAVAVLTEKTYRDPKQLADEIALRMDAAAGVGETITCVWNSTGADAGKFTITASGTVVFSILWNTGANTANSAKTKLGFANTDDTGALFYKSDVVIDWAAPYTPTFDSTQPIVAKNGEVLFGLVDDIACAGFSSAEINITNEQEDLPDICEESGLQAIEVTRRQVEINVVGYVNKHDIRLFNRFREGVKVRVAINVGEKLNSNWVPGKCVNYFAPNVKITAFTVDTTGEFAVINVTGVCVADDTLSTRPDFTINYL